MRLQQLVLFIYLLIYLFFTLLLIFTFYDFYAPIKQSVLEISVFLADMSYFYFLFLFNNFVFLCLILTYSLETHVMLILILIDIEHLQNVPFSFQKVRMVKITPRHISTTHKYSSAAKYPVTPLHWKGQISILLTSSCDRENFSMFPTA